MSPSAPKVFVVAKKMLAAGLSLSSIIELTGLTEEAILALNP
jgi:hypothetical protein